jgi:hypothetical protein
VACRRSHNMTAHLEREGSSLFFEGKNPKVLTNRTISLTNF